MKQRKNDKYMQVLHGMKCFWLVLEMQEIFIY